MNGAVRHSRTVMALLAMGSTAAMGQTSLPPQIGERLQMRTRLDEGRGWHLDCDGRVTGIVGDTLVLTPPSSTRWCPRQVYAPSTIERIRVARGDRGSRAVHVGIGTLIGAVVGGASMYVAIRSTCHDAGCSQGDNSGITTLAVLVGGVLTAPVGAVIGALVPAGPRWIPLPGRVPVRVAEDATRGRTS